MKIKSTLILRSSLYRASTAASVSRRAAEAVLRKRAAASGKQVTTEIYRDAGHALLADYRPIYREKPAFEMWTDITDFFGR